MEQVKQEAVIEAEYEEVAPESTEEKPEGSNIAVEIHIQVTKEGQLNVGVPEGYPELKPVELEQIVRQVYEQLHDMRIASMTFEMFKQRLG